MKTFTVEQADMTTYHIQADRFVSDDDRHYTFYVGDEVVAEYDNVASAWEVN